MGPRVILAALLALVAFGCNNAPAEDTTTPTAKDSTTKKADTDGKAGGQLGINPNYKGK